MKAIIAIIPKYTQGPNKGQDWSPLTESHVRILIGEAMKRTGLEWEIIRLEE